MTQANRSFWSDDLERAQAYLDYCAERLLDPDDQNNLAHWLGQQDDTP